MVLSNKPIVIKIATLSSAYKSKVYIGKSPELNAGKVTCP